MHTNIHQGNTESASVKLEVLGTMGVPQKRFEALPVLTVSSKRVEARRISAEYFFSHWPGLRVPDLGGVDDAHARNKHQFIQRYTT